MNPDNEVLREDSLEGNSDENSTTFDQISHVILRGLKERTSVKYLQIRTQETKPSLLDTKIGGIPYFPIGAEYPKHTRNDTPLYLLCQLNFDTLPKLEDFPQTGILQIFIDGDVFMGMDFDDPTAQDSWRIVYYPTIDTDPTHQQKLPDLPKPERFPFEGEYKLSVKPSIGCIRSGDYRFTKVVNGLFEGELSANGWSDWEIHDHQMMDTQYGGSRIGGYPTFVQEDPRKYNNFEKTVLLFELESDRHVMWGDMGVANFLISKEALRNCDFLDVYYVWDCS
ncbi:putative protein of unknown function (DUF1963) [Blattamonas nauphoetae]|uniref:DUF1963 domain-containing protein n=1 Tax=Blattamonas nauphoetae TaxID=2049346 RepID=A0ABQ9XTH7_9EUKA|nr:putative protein of unknown function (DUF1963) [Blattamonas nauphoetae]